MSDESGVFSPKRMAIRWEELANSISHGIAYLRRVNRARRFLLLEASS